MPSVIQLREKRGSIFERMKSVSETASPVEWRRLEDEYQSLTNRIDERERAEASKTIEDLDFAGDEEFRQFLTERGSAELNMALPVGVERRDLLAGSGSGASAIPPGFLAALRAYLVEVSGIRLAGATVITSQTG